MTIKHNVQSANNVQMDSGSQKNAVKISRLNANPVVLVGMANSSENIAGKPRIQFASNAEIVMLVNTLKDLVVSLTTQCAPSAVHAHQVSKCHVYVA